MRRINRLTAGLVVALVLSGSACGGDDEPAAQEAANAKAQPTLLSVEEGLNSQWGEPAPQAFIEHATP